MKVTTVHPGRDAAVFAAVGADRDVQGRQQSQVLAPVVFADQLRQRRRVFQVDELDSLMCSPTVTDEAVHGPYEDLAQRWLDLAATDPVNGRLTTDREVFLPADLLPKVDRMSMAHSLEVRVPYLDNQVVDLMLSVRGSLKQSLRRDKILLRRAMAGVIPATAAT